MTTRNHGVEISTKPEVWYYVETAIIHRGSLAVEEQTTFRAHLVQERSPRLAEVAAVAEARRANPDAEDIHFFMSRRLTDEKAQSIADRFADKTWEGWRF